MLLPSGAADVLRREAGFGVTLVVTNADGVRRQILDIARNHFNALEKKKEKSARQVFKQEAVAHILNQASAHPLPYLHAFYFPAFSYPHLQCLVFCRSRSLTRTGSLAST